MRVIYADPGLRTYRGHHYGYCRSLTRSFAAKGCEVIVATAADAQREVVEEFQAMPLFRCSTYYLNDGDPIVGWLNAFYNGTNVNRSDFASIPGLRRNDVIYVATGQPSQVLGIAQWLASVPLHERPGVVMELLYTPGVDIVKKEKNKDVFVTMDPRDDPRGALYRFAGLRMQALDVTRFNFITQHRHVVDIYQYLLGKPVKFVNAMPVAATQPLRRRTGRRPINISVLGHQWEGKGYHLVPEVLTRLLAARTDIRITVHNNDQSLADTQLSFRQLAAKDNRWTVLDDTVDATAWQRLLDESDLMLCPYHHNIYRITGSGIVAEALANGIPLVVPAKTMLEEQVQEFGSTGTSFAEFTAASVLDACERLLSAFDRYAEIAHSGAKKWAKTQGPDKYIDAVLRAAR